MRPLDFYRLGLAAASNATTEPVQRMAVGRLYYGLHHEACCRYFRVNPNADPLHRTQRHSELRNRFNSLNDPGSRTIGGLLHSLLTLRAEADYNISAPLRFRNRVLSPEAMLRTALASARQLLAALENYSPGEAEDGCRCPTA